jgi:hypothetical protein
LSVGLLELNLAHNSKSQTTKCPPVGINIKKG